MLWHPLFSFTAGEAVAVTPTAQPSGGWESIAEVFRVREESLRDARNRRQRRDAEADIKREAEREIARIAQEAKQARAKDLEEVIRRVDSAALAFGDFYRKLLEDQLLAIREREEAAMRAAAEEMARQLEAKRRQDEEAILLLIAML
jgi:hypothetical protein